MKNVQTLDREGFLDVLGNLPSEIWTASVEKSCLHLRRSGSAVIYSPLTAVYWNLTEGELHRGSFSHPEITARFHLPWWEILEIAYAEICLVRNGKHYRNKLRLRMLEAVAPLVRADGLKDYLANFARECETIKSRHSP